MKYSKSEIMTRAWSLFKMSQKWVDSLTFSECLRRAWGAAKMDVKNTQKLMSNGCMKVVNGSRLGLRRTVVAARKELKAAGFRWDSEASNWFTTDRKVAEYFC